MPEHFLVLILVLQFRMASAILTRVHYLGKCLCYLLRKRLETILTQTLHKGNLEGLSWWSTGWDSVLPMQGTQVQSMVRELGPTCCNQDPVQQSSFFLFVFFKANDPPDRAPSSFSAVTWTGRKVFSSSFTSPGNG